MDVLDSLPKPFFVLAPMFEVTDSVFRQVVAASAPPDVYFTEFVNVDGLQSPGQKKLLKYLKHTDAEQPLFAQIWGKDPANYYQTAKQLADGSLAGKFAGVDINMGCPDKSIVSNGCCTALISNRELAGEIINATQKGAGDLPVSVKTRIGFNEIDLTWIEFLLQKKLNMLSIHLRTRKEMSKVPPHWEVMPEIMKLRDRIAPRTLIVANGDIMTRDEGLKLAKKYGLDGVMIGRGVFQDPFVFAERSPWEVFTKQQRLELYQKHVQLFADTWKDDERRVVTLNKFCKVYIQSFDGAKELRERLMAAQTADELLRILTDTLEQL